MAVRCVASSLNLAEIGGAWPCCEVNTGAGATVSAFLTSGFCRGGKPTVNHRTIDRRYHIYSCQRQSLMVLSLPPEARVRPSGLPARRKSKQFVT